jgi:hypothetical protein
VKQQFDTLTQREVTENQVEQMLNCRDALREIAILGQLKDIPNIQEFATDFMQKKQRCKELSLVRLWLQAMNTSFEIPRINAEDNTITLLQLDTQITQFIQQVNLNEQDINTLIFFLSKKSSLFETISQKYKQQLKKDVRNSLYFMLMKLLGIIS